MIEKKRVIWADCPYCGHIPYVGESPPLDPKTPFDTILAQGPGIVVTPTVGMLVPGYLLAISKKHLPSYAYLEASELETIQIYVEEFIGKIHSLFGEYLIFEHGPGIGVERGWHGGCIEHAHFHLIPVARQIGEIVLSALSFSPIKDLAALTDARERRYALVGLAGKYYLALGCPLPSQWIRKLVAETINTTRSWDWAVDKGNGDLEKTVVLLRKAGLLP